MWATCPLSDSSGYHAEFHEGYQKHTNPLNCRTSSSDISGYDADFHEGHGAVGEWQRNGMACVNYVCIVRTVGVISKFSRCILSNTTRQILL
jgi:hypothetical protein